MLDTTIGSHVAHNARRFPGKVAIVDSSGKLTYAELERNANRVANALLNAGIGRSDKVALLVKSSIDFVTIFIGIAKIGATTVPLNYRLTWPEIAATIADSESRVLFAHSEYLAKTERDEITTSRIVTIDGAAANSLSAFLEGADVVPVNIVVEPSDAQLIMYTGGTTGKSKGVVLTHENVFWNTINEVVDTDMEEDDNTIVATPLHHAAALNCWLIPHLYLGATTTILHDYSPEQLLRAIAEHRVTNGFTPPSMARDLYTHSLAKQLDLSCFKRWYVGGATMSRRDRDAMHELLPGMKIYYQYGITEAGPIVTVLKEKDYERAPGSIGRAFINCEVKILRDDMTDAAINEAGEIVVRGRQVMREYYNQPEATKAAFYNGWFRTGDLGSIDSDGYVTFHDRLKDMVKTGGLNVFSQEVEQVLQKHPSIREIAVIGMPSEKWGEEVTGVVVLRDGYSATAEDIIAFGRESLAHYKVPKTILFLDYKDMPINYSGKIMKRDLRKKLGAI